MRPTGPSSVAVIGLGLIGGSLARELARDDVRVLGHDRDAEAVTAAMRAGAVHARLDDSFDGIEEAEIVLIALPVSAGPTLLRRLAPRLGCARLVMDVGSTKASMDAAALELGLERFVGAHPLTGDHRSGWGAARDGLFRDQRVFLCPSRVTRPDALAAAGRFWQARGSECTVMDAAEHDRRLAWISHLPQMVSSALALTLGRRGFEPADLGRGARDMTRLAGSSSEVWSAIALGNAAAIAGGLSAVIDELDGLRHALLRGDAEATTEFLAAGAHWRGA